MQGRPRIANPSPRGLQGRQERARHRCVHTGILEYPDRLQPFTTWHMGAVVYFSETREDAQRALARVVGWG